MRQIKYFCLSAVAACLFFASTPKSHAQIAVQIGPAPICPYGYYAYPPYYCAPYGYYGPNWFLNGIFIGAGPWYHGRASFHGYVDRHYDPHYGYHGPYPNRGEHADWGHHQNFRHEFHGNEMHDGHGNVVGHHH
jgi:hypothetical protein